MDTDVVSSVGFLLKAVGYIILPLVGVIYYSLTGRVKKLEIHMDEEPEAIRNRMLEHVRPLEVRIEKVENLNTDITTLKIQMAVLLSQMEALIITVQKLVDKSEIK